MAVRMELVKEYRQRWRVEKYAEGENPAESRSVVVRKFRDEGLTIRELQAVTGATVSEIKKGIRGEKMYCVGRNPEKLDALGQW